MARVIVWFRHSITTVENAISIFVDNITIVNFSYVMMIKEAMKVGLSELWILTLTQFS